MSLGFLGDRTEQEVLTFTESLMTWWKNSGISAEQLKKNIIDTTARIEKDWRAANIPDLYNYELHSVYRTPEEQIETFKEDWQADPHTRHVFGQAADVHIFKDGKRIYDNEMKDFFNQYIAGKFLEYQKLYTWGFHTHWKTATKAIITAAGLALAGVLLYFIFKK